MTSFPPRLHCILAREARLGIVIRRGPSKSVCTLKWDLDKDTFKLGQWMRGRIYERRCDLSPDGKHFLYFAMNGRWQSESTGAWTAISKTPYLKATIMLTKGDCWHGGGLFTSNHRYWLNDGYGHQVLRDNRQLIRDSSFQPKEHFGGECLHVYYNRLMRYGWTLLDEKSGSAHAIFEKPLGLNLVLRKYCFAEINQPPGNGCYYDRHAIITKTGELVQDFPHWQWAELDKRRLIWAEDGRLFSGYVHKSGVRNPKLLHNFSAMRFEARPAPY
ncbi:MAG: hypothetical protein QM715_04380 [Nibricoccus sp.]